MKILCLGPNKMKDINWGHELFKKELSKQHEVRFYGSGYPDFNDSLPISKILLNYKKNGINFDILLTYEAKWVRKFRGFNQVTIPKIHIQNDYVDPKLKFPNFSTWDNVNGILKIIEPTIILARSTKAVKDLKNNLKHDKVFFFPFSVDIERFTKLKMQKTIDVMCSYNDNKVIYPKRHLIKRESTRLRLHVFFRRVMHDRYIQHINKSKIFINSNSINNGVTMKFTEVLSCGTFLLTEKPEDLKRYGFENETHLITFENLEEFKTKVKYYLKHEEVREKIALQGKEFVKENHSNTVRVKQFTDLVRRECGIQ